MAETEMAKVATAEAPSRASGEVILIVEDDDDVRRYATAALTKVGYAVVAAADGHEALRLLDGIPDLALLLTDVVLPGGMNGRSLADQVQRRRRGVKVLFMTGYTRNAIVHHGVLDIDVKLLAKPFTIQSLTAKVREAIDARQYAE